MTFTQDIYGFTLRLEKGEKLVECLTGFVKEQNLRAGWVLGLGGLAWAELGFYALDQGEYKWTKLDELLELTNLTGNIAWQDDQPALHLHATVSKADYSAMGGHLREAEVGGTVELSIRKWVGDDLVRRRDEQTGLNLLNL